MSGMFLVNQFTYVFLYVHDEFLWFLFCFEFFFYIYCIFDVFYLPLNMWSHAMAVP